MTDKFRGGRYQPPDRGAIAALAIFYIEVDVKRHGILGLPLARVRRARTRAEVGAPAFDGRSSSCTRSPHWPGLCTHQSTGSHSTYLPQRWTLLPGGMVTFVSARLWRAVTR